MFSNFALALIFVLFPLLDGGIRLLIINLAHLRPNNPASRVWLEDSPDLVFDLALSNLCNSLDLI